MQFSMLVIAVMFVLVVSFTFVELQVLVEWFVADNTCFLIVRTLYQIRHIYCKNWEHHHTQCC